MGLTVELVRHAVAGCREVLWISKKHSRESYGSVKQAGGSVAGKGNGGLKAAGEGGEEVSSGCIKGS